MGVSHELRVLKGEDVYRNEKGQLIVHVLSGKGGKERWVIVLPALADRVEEIARRKPSKQRIFESIKKHAPIHRYRGDYASAYYKLFARPIAEIPQNDRYCCRKDMAGVIFDKKAMLNVSKQLGHERISVIAENYLY